ncbi:hypothetical protein CPB84DRAFT_1772447 [Gymnopilus junonius]|uniref:Uncharacterized protein n=1 Tax=Gymnopilus junonius TaxID=109634 RepID=A0A9P5NSG5_GYMJU|nr:hypothetical protein CPB84DRAFT_1772447 [Gymnopilus junonius]
MRSFNAPFALIAALVSSAAAQTFTINTPLNVQVCLPVLINWTGGTPPYFLSILPAGQPSANALVDLGQQSGNSVTWIANLPVGTGAFLDLRDNTGTLAQSGSFTIQTGTNTSCVGQAASISAGPAVTGGTSGGSSIQANVNSATSSSPASPTSKGASSTTAKPTTSPSKAAAVAQYAPVGAAAMIGAAILSIVV